MFLLTKATIIWKKKSSLVEDDEEDNSVEVYQ